MSAPSFLYVEDDDLSRQVMLLQLQTVLGYQDVTIFEDSANFMERVRQLPSVPDVIFLDIQMRPLDGYEMLRLLRQDAAYRDTTVIALTANVMATDVEQLQAAGFSGLIGKPIPKRMFPDLLKRILDGESIWYVS